MLRSVCYISLWYVNFPKDQMSLDVCVYIYIYIYIYIISPNKIVNKIINKKKHITRLETHSFLFIYIKFYKYKNNNKFLYNFYNVLKLRKGLRLYFEIGCSYSISREKFSDNNSNNKYNKMKNARWNDVFLIKMILLYVISSTHQLEQNGSYLTGMYAVHNNYK